MFQYFVCLIIALGSGAAALSHELLWTRRLVDILGASGEATSLTLGCFFCGLSLGAAIAARRVSHVKNAWATLARLECTIALLALPAALLPYWTSWIWPALGLESLVSWSGRFVKLVVSGLVVLPPATAMGMTLPVLIVAMGRTVSDSPRLHVLVYAFNTLGGAIGLLVTSIWLLQSFGVFGSMLVAALVNGAVGLVAWSLRSQSENPTVRLPKRERKRALLSEDRNALPKNWLLLMACFSGFAVLSLEVVVIRLLSLVVPSSFQATSSVLLTVILLLGVAALVVPAIERLVPYPKLLLLAFMSCAAVASALSPSLLYERTKQLIDVPHLVAIDGRTMGGLWGFHLEVLSVALSTVGPALLLSAAVFPTLLACVGRKEKGATGRQWATLLAVNGVGGLVGTLVTEQLLIPRFGIYGGMVAVGCVQALVACLAAVTLTTRWASPLMIPGSIALLCCLFLNGRLEQLAYISPHTTLKYRVLESRFGKDGVCCVVKTQTDSKGIMLNNQYLLGTTGVTDAQRRQVLIPLLLHSAKNESSVSVAECQVCCLGLATGISAGAALDFSEECRVTAVELSPTVIEVAKDHFAVENRNLVLDPRTTVVAEDARTYMAAVRDEFDVVAGDLYRPYASGQGRLYSLEHFRNVRNALRTGGIYCQWVPAFQVTEDHFDMIAATFVQAFPDAVLLCADAETKHPMLGLLGTKDAENAWSQMEVGFQESTTRHGVKDATLLAEGYANSLFVANLSQEQFAGIPINTLENAILEINAGRHRATHDRRQSGPASSSRKDSYLRGEVWNAYLKKMNAGR